MIILSLTEAQPVCPAPSPAASHGGIHFVNPGIYKLKIKKPVPGFLV